MRKPFKTHCRFCHRPLEGGKCKPCFFEHINGSYKPGSIGRKVEAEKLKWDIYPDYCSTHGLIEFGVSNMRCVECAPEDYQERDARAVARKKGSSKYIARCDTHGLAAFHVRNGLCSICFNSVGGVRPWGDAPSPRSLARKAGEKTYMGGCETHGHTAHYVATGRCATCFTSAGMVRTRDPSSARAEARAAGQSIYLDTCVTHGDRAPHYVLNGKCSRCFTTAGVARQPESMSKLAAESALARGDLMFFWLCNKCGPGEFSARGRRCLRCDSVATD